MSAVAVAFAVAGAACLILFAARTEVLILKVIRGFSSTRDRANRDITQTKFQPEMYSATNFPLTVSSCLSGVK